MEAPFLLPVSEGLFGVAFLMCAASSPADGAGVSTLAGARHPGRDDRHVLRKTLLSARAEGVSSYSTRGGTSVINVTTDASESDMEKVKTDLRRFCPVSKVVRNAGTDIDEIWNVNRR